MRVARLRVGPPGVLRRWPLYEVVDGCHRLTYEPEHPVPVAEWLAPQKRFAHLLQPENRGRLVQIQAQVDADWDALVARCGGPLALA